MVSLKTRRLIVLALCLVLSFSPTIPREITPANAQGLLPHDPIRITRDSDFANSNSGVVSGAGTSLDPYIIEGWDINATTGLDKGSIEILNTRSYFIIRNVYIHPTSLVREASGIRINNIENGVIENARITNNTYGIWLGSSLHSSMRTNTVWNNTNGIYVIGGQDNIISYNKAFNNTQYGIWVSSASRSTFRGNTATGSAAGFIIGGAHDNLFESNLSFNNIDNPIIPTGYGFRITASYNNIFRNNTIFGTPFGMIFEVSTGNLAIGNNSTLNQYGMGLEGRNKNNTFTANRVTKNDYGIYVFNSSQNIVYNNYLQNTLSNAYDDTLLNYWNTSKSLGTNILGGPIIGGNFYSDYQGGDANGDGIGDSPYSVTGRYPDPNQDRLPLVRIQPSEVHDIAASSVTAQPAVPVSGQVVNITALFLNLGTFSESFTARLYYDQTVIGLTNITDLGALSMTTYTLQWNTTGLSDGSYTIRANLTKVPGETFVSNNVSPPTVVTLGHNQPPVANFTFTPANPLTGTAVNFDGSQSYDPDGTISDYNWDFGDSTTGTGKNATHVYVSTGTFTVTLTITDNQGGIGTTSKPLTVTAIVDIEVIEIQAVPLVANPGQTVLVSVYLVNAGSSTQSFTLNAYENDTYIGSTQVLDLHAHDSGVYPVHWSTQGFSPGVYFFSASVPPLPGEQDTGDNTLVDGTARLNAPPSAQFSFSPQTPNLGDDVAFDASQSSDIDGTITSYAWDFGDGQTGTGAQIIHAFQSLGTYTVTLTVEDNDGTINSRTGQIRLNAPPTANFTTTPEALAETNVGFNASSSSDPDGTVVQYSWDFGDGTTGAGIAPSHIYTKAANYTVTLKAYDNNGALATLARKITVGAQPPGPPLELKASYSYGKIRLTWSAPSRNGGSPIVGYQLWRGTSPTYLGSSPLATVGNVTSYEDGRVSGGQVYYYEVRTVNVAGISGEASDKASFEVPLPVGPRGSSFLDNMAVWTPIAVVVVVLVAALALVARRRKKG